MNQGSTGSLESKKDFKDTPEGKYQYWATELKTSIKALEPWWRRADKIVKRYLGRKATDPNDTKRTGGFDLNLFHSNFAENQP